MYESLEQLLTTDVT